MPGAVKRDEPLAINHQKTTGAHFCQLLTYTGWTVDTARVIVFSPLWQLYPNQLRLPLERVDRKGHEDSVVYHQADDLNLHGRRQRDRARAIMSTNRSNSALRLIPKAAEKFFSRIRSIFMTPTIWPQRISMSW